MRATVLVVANLLLGGCTEYVELHNTTDRIWIMSKDGSTVLRCLDLTPDQKPFAGNAKVFCKAAYMYGTVTKVDVDATDGPRATTPTPPGKPHDSVESEMK
jgi:hypothetical protein